MPTTAIAAMMAVVEAIKYISVGGGVGFAVGAGVGATSSTMKAVCADEP